MLHWQQLLLVVAQGHLSSSSFPSWQCFSQITVRNLWRRTTATTVRSQQRTMKQRIMWKPLQCLQELVAHENNCTVCSITTNMISLLSLLPLHTTYALHGVQACFLLFEGCVSARPWLAIQHPTKRNFTWICKGNSPPRWAPRQRMLYTNFQAGWASETPKLPQYHKSDSSKHVSKKLIWGTFRVGWGVTLRQWKWPLRPKSQIATCPKETDSKV